MNSIPKDRLRMSVIGVGAMGAHHARISSQMEDVDLVGVADLDSAVRNRVAARYHTRGYADYRTLVETAKPDLAVVAAPTHLHFPIASDLIERGIHVLVEKPITRSLEEGQALVGRARERGVVLGVGHVERFNPAVAALRERLKRGQLGQIFEISVRRISGFPPRVRDVGVAMDLATHDLDVLCHLTGAQVTRVSAETARKLQRPHEDLLCGLLRFNNGVIGLLHVNWLSPTKIRELGVNGERGMFVVNYLTQDLRLYENSFSDGDWESLQVFRGVAEGRMIRYPIARREPLQVELEAFVGAVRDGVPFPVSGEDGLRALKLAQCLVEAGRLGQSISFTPRTCTSE